MLRGVVKIEGRGRERNNEDEKDVRVGERESFVGESEIIFIYNHLVCMTQPDYIHCQENKDVFLLFS